MKKSDTTFRALASFLFLLSLATVAHAQNTRTWVSGTGNDANPCSYASPCRTFAAALALTNAGGEINAKKAGRFGNVTIAKSITIDGGGTFSGIVQGGGNSAIIVDDSASATPNTAVVTLRNISINGVGNTLGSNGVNFLAGKTLNIENCQIQNFSNAGINISLGVSGSNVNIKNTNIFSATTGVRATISVVGFVTVSLNGCNIEQNTTAGVTLLTGGYSSIRDSAIHFNGFGVQITGASNSVNIKNSQINHNTTGLSVGATTLATLGSSTILANGTNFLNSGTIQTFGDNQTETNPIPGVVTNLGLR